MTNDKGCEKSTISDLMKKFRCESVEGMVKEKLDDCVKIMDEAELSRTMEQGKHVASLLALGWISGITVRRVSTPLVLAVGGGLLGAYYLRAKNIVDFQWNEIRDSVNLEEAASTVKTKIQDDIGGAVSLALGFLIGFRKQ